MAKTSMEDRVEQLFQSHTLRKPRRNAVLPKAVNLLVRQPESASHPFGIVSENMNVVAALQHRLHEVEGMKSALNYYSDSHAQDLASTKRGVPLPANSKNACAIPSAAF